MWARLRDDATRMRGAHVLPYIRDPRCSGEKCVLLILSYRRILILVSPNYFREKKKKVIMT